MASNQLLKINSIPMRAKQRPRIGLRSAFVCGFYKSVLEKSRIDADTLLKTSNLHRSDQ